MRGSPEALPDKPAVTKGRLALSTETAQMLNHIDPFTPPHRRFVSTHRQAHSLNHKLLCPEGQGHTTQS